MCFVLPSNFSSNMSRLLRMQAATAELLVRRRPDDASHGYACSVRSLPQPWLGSLLELMIHVVVQTAFAAPTCTAA